MKYLLPLLLLISTAALADDNIPDVDTIKVEVLKRAYHMNGDSMVRMGSIDMSQMPWPLPPTVDETKHPYPSIITVDKDKPKPKRKSKK